MITLSIASVINSVLGANSPVNYDKVVLSPITIQPIQRVIQGSLNLTSTASPNMQAVVGTFTVDLVGATCSIFISQLNFQRRIVLTGPQVSAAQTIINDTQNSVENGLISLGLISGTQAAGV